MSGRVEAIHVAAAAGVPMEHRERVRAIAGAGLEGDRYAAGTGHWSPIRRRGDGLTVISAEVLAAVNAEHGLALTDAAVRRNVTVRGVDLEALIGREFRIGTVRCLAVRRCEPCQYLEGLLGQAVVGPLVHRGGIRVEVLEDGEIAVGDAVEAVGDPVEALGSTVLVRPSRGPVPGVG